MEDNFAKLSIVDSKAMKPASVFTSTNKGICGAYTIAVKPGTKIFRYDVEIIKKHPTDEAKNKVLSRPGRDDGEASLRHILCLQVMEMYAAATNNFGTGLPGNIYVFDGVKNLYLSSQMNIPSGKKLLVFAPTDFTPFGQKQLCDWSISIEVSPSEQPVIDISKPEAVLGTRENPGDRTVSQFFDVLTSQVGISRASHVSLGLGKLYRRMGDVMQNTTMELKAGMSKGISPLEVNGKISLALIVDAKKTAFYNAVTLDAALKGALSSRFCNVRDIGAFYRNVRVTPSYANHRTDIIEEFLDKGPNDILVDGKKMTEYFREKYNIECNTKLPVVKTDRAMFPMDVLVVCPNQRVPMEKLDDITRRAILMATAVPPNERFTRIREEVASASVVPSNELMKKFGVSISTTMLTVDIKSRATPIVLAGTKQVQQEVKNAGWRLNGGVLLPTKSLDGGFIVLAPSNFDARKFVEQLVRSGVKYGLKLPMPTFEVLDLSSYNSMLPKFKDLEARKTRFVLVFDHQRNKSHANLKLLERETGVLTMQVRVETTTRPGGIGQTLENLLLKINGKANGINFVPVIEKCGEMLSLQKKVLVVGIDVSLPPRGTDKELYSLRQKGLGNLSSHEAAVVGIAGNYGPQNMTILGDYYFQESSHEVLNRDIILKRFVHILTRFSKVRGGMPEHIVVFRDGVGEGQLHKTTQWEYPIYEQACREVQPGAAIPGIIYIIVTKRHNKRFALGEPGKEVNLSPGSVIDKGISRPDLTEFYMQSHRPLKGTGKTAHYTVMMNPKNITLDAIQAFANHLCFDHQVVTSAVSLPEPVYHAKEMTKRGRNNLHAKRNVKNGEVPRTSNGLMDFAMVSACLSYQNIALSNIKFAA